jgi:hypothetical protein
MLESFYQFFLLLLSLLGLSSVYHRKSPWSRYSCC